MFKNEMTVKTDEKDGVIMNSAADVWQMILSLMEKEMTAVTINTWFDDVQAVALEGTRFILHSPTQFKRDIIRSRYVPAVQKGICRDHRRC